jgi:AbiEi antitoxin C-terminal domain
MHALCAKCHSTYTGVSEVKVLHRTGRVPSSVASVVARLAQDRPAVVTVDDLAVYVNETNTDRGVESVLRELVASNWLVPSGRRGVWAFIAPGEEEVIDPYVELRAWATKKGVVFALAGESAAWHLGLLARRSTGPVSIWIPEHTVLPKAMRDDFSTVTLGWGAEMVRRVGPRRAWLRERGLDLTRWSSGLPAFGPEALLVQLAVRPTSFHPWGDLAVNLRQLASACDHSTLLGLLGGQSTPAHQRAAYLLDIGQQPEVAAVVLSARPTQLLSRLTLGDGAEGAWSKKYRITDRLVVPFLARFGKA